jgi:hypothetical protein
MPLNEEILYYSGRYAFKNKNYWKNENFADWLKEKGYTGYFHYLMVNPARTSFEIWKSYRETVNVFCLGYTGRTGYKTWLARVAQKLIFFRWWSFPELPFIFCLIISWFTARRLIAPIACCAWGVFIFTLGLPLQSAIIYVADAMEIQRHSLTVTLTIRLLFFISILLFINLLILAIRRYTQGIRISVINLFKRLQKRLSISKVNLSRRP